MSVEDEIVELYLVCSNHFVEYGMHNINARLARLTAAR